MFVPKSVCPFARFYFYCISTLLWKLSTWSGWLEQLELEAEHAQLCINLGCRAAGGRVAQSSALAVLLQ